MVRLLAVPLVVLHVGGIVGVSLTPHFARLENNRLRLGQVTRSLLPRLSLYLKVIPDHPQHRVLDNVCPPVL